MKLDDYANKLITNYDYTGNFYDAKPELSKNYILCTKENDIY